MKSLTEWVQLAALVLIGAGGLSFLAAQLIKQPSWPSSLKLILSLVLGLIFGTLTAWMNADVWHIVRAWGSLSAGDVMTFAAFVWAASTGWYMLVFKNAEWAVHLGEWPKKV